MIGLSALSDQWAVIRDQWKRLEVYGGGEKDRRVESFSEERVVCADRCREIYRSATGWKGQLAITGALFSCMVLGVATGMAWLTFAGFATFFVMIVRTLVKVHRFFANLPCPRCAEPVGKYETRKTRLHLCCVHCGHVAPTDCRIYYSGQIPEKG